jgi:tetratricopeptide (TPR) repeat protein/glycosyltransferase involved in cell wall biosynthesis
MTSQVKTLISFATRWGPQFGGINCFNKDLLEAFSAAFSPHIHIVCVVLQADKSEIQEAKNSQVTLVSLNLTSVKKFSAEFAVNTWDVLPNQFKSDPSQIVWLGHDLITGEIAVNAAKIYKGRSALINHMSYDHYESFCENSSLAKDKNKAQRKLFEQAGIVMAVGPLLRDALSEMLDVEDIPMLVPGLADITVKKVFKTFRGFISGRLSDDAKKIKQGHLGVAAFARSIKKADTNIGLPDVLRGSNEPELTLRGIDFEQYNSHSHDNAENELKRFAETHAGRAIRMHALPFTTDRLDLFNDLRSASVAMMPSWHEGFGLVGWEAIAAGVPLIISQKSGVYRILSELKAGLYTSYVYPIDIAGSIESPFFQEKDQEALANKIIEVAKSHSEAQQKATQLREALLQVYTWNDCALQLAKILNWEQHATPLNPHVEKTPHQPSQLSTDLPANILEMPRPTWTIDSGFTSSRLLRAEEAIIPFDPNRKPFLEGLIQWAQSTQYPIAIQLLTGVGGTGKTRLAIELCEQLQQHGWQTGFLANDARVANITHNLVKSNQDICLIIDYAETRQPQLLELIKTLSNNIQQKVRIVLLARDSGEWWNMLPGKDPACEALLESLATTGPYYLSQLHDSLQSRQAAYQVALAAFANKLSLPIPLTIPKLNDEHFGHPLYVQMAALLALHGEVPGSAESVARSLINHERRYWTKASSVIPLLATQQDDSAALFMALVTLINGLATIRDCEKLWTQYLGVKEHLKPLFSMLTPLYPSRQGLFGLQPDLLGEALVAQCILGVKGQELLHATLGCKNAKWRQNSLTVLARIMRNREDISNIVLLALTTHFVNCATEIIAVMMETPSPFAQVATQAFINLNTQQKNQACGILNVHLKDDILPLIDLGVLVKRTNVAKLRQKAKQNTSKDLASLARALSSLGTNLAWQGNIDEALSYSKQALDIDEKLAKAKPERFEPDWARSLNNYANRLSDLGRAEEALNSAKQALDIYEKLAKAKPERFEPDWATSLNNYANHLSDLGRAEEVLNYATQAVDISEKLAKAKPERFEPDWARSLNNYASHLSDLGRAEEALNYATQAVDICEKLAKAKPERFEPDWARSLNNYASHLSDLGRTEEALNYATQAVDISEKLAKAKPERFEPDWATSLNNYANHLSDLGRAEEALNYATQAVDISEKLAKAKPERFEPDWATSLNNYASHLSDLGRAEEALNYATQAMDISEKLAKAKPERFEPDWARSLNNYANRLSDLGRAEEALNPAKQALDIYEKLAKAKPERFEPDWARSLNNYANCLSDLGRAEEALNYAKQSLDIYEKLVKAKPKQFEYLFLSSIIISAQCDWLATKQLLEVEFVITQHTTPRKKFELDFNRYYLRAFAENDQTLVGEAISEAETCWTKMDAAQRRSCEDRRLLLAGLAESKKIACSLICNWRESLESFLAQRNGRLPLWMQEMARRADFTLSE